MREGLHKYFSGGEVALYHNHPELQWEAASALTPSLSKGWFELSKLDGAIRLEFIRDYWINALPNFPHVFAFLDRFFAGVKEVGIVGHQGDVYMTYECKHAFFMGGLPLVDREIEALKRQFDFPLPQDYLQFFRIHNGFSKSEDLGVLPSHSLKMADSGEHFPFYRASKPEIYQCFKNDEEVSNSCCSLEGGKIFATEERNSFHSFLDWLNAYMERSEER